MPSESTDTAANQPLFSIGAERVNAEKIMAEIKAVVAGKAARGVYRDLRVAQAERANLVNLSDDESFLKYYLECLRNAVFVDINDFEIRERRRFGSVFLVALKKIVWSILKFYTYRLWSQQNQINGLLVTAVESLDEKYRARIEKLEREAPRGRPQGIFAEPCEARSRSARSEASERGEASEQGAEASERANNAIFTLRSQSKAKDGPPCGKPQGFLAKKGQLAEPENKNKEKNISR